ncbi:hypothetical protein HZC33_01305 [Candidatus Wolfebacteria bacterium]|nr:hypothetical protein [Candidatus Wolfebacteria bacterium]
METKHNHEDHCFFCKWKGFEGGHKKNVVIRWVLGILILITIFYFGVKIGQISYYVRSGFGYPMMGGYPMMWGGYGSYGKGYSDDGYYGGMGPWMMRGWWNYPTQNNTQK